MAATLIFHMLLDTIPVVFLYVLTNAQDRIRQTTDYVLKLMFTCYGFIATEHDKLQ